MTAYLRAEAVLLDMDGTLVDSTAVVERVWSDWALAHRFDPAAVLEVIHGRQGHESMAILLPERSAEANRADNLRLLEREVAELDGVVEVPGARAFVAALAGVPHALVTSATRELAMARMRAAGIPLPEVAVTAEAVVASKPDPEGFLTAARMLGVAPGGCVVFEDSGAGIAAGRAAGMRVVGVGARAAAHGPDRTVPDLSRIAVRAEPDACILELTDTL